MLRKLRKSHILFFIFVFGLVSLCLTNGFANDDDAILEGGFDFPTPNSAGHIQDAPGSLQRVPQFIFGSADFEKMRDLPQDSQDYQLGTKVGWFVIRNRSDSGSWICTGFLVGPDLFMTNHHCIHDDFGLLPIAGARIFMDYYQEPDVDPTRGGITARVSEILRMDEEKDYALLRLDSPIGNTYGWLELDTTTDAKTGQSVKIIHHSEGGSKEISRRNSEIVDIPANFIAQFPRLNYALAYLADTQGGSSGGPVFLLNGTGVIAINHSGWFLRGIDGTIIPQFNAGTLMAYIVPEIQQWLPNGPPTPPEPGPDLIVESPRVDKSSILPSESFTLSVTVRNQGDATTPATTLRFYESLDDSITSLDTEVDTASVGSLAPDATIEVSVTLTAFALGTFYYGACIDEVANETNIDNNCSTGVKVTVSIGPTPPNPVLGFNPPTIADQTFPVNTPITPLALPLATGGTAPYTYTLSPVPPGLDFDPFTQHLTGTPTTVGTTNVTYTATDTTGVSGDLTFTITVTGSGPGPGPGGPLDVDGDGQITVIDLAIVALFYGTEVPLGMSLPADVNADGIVNILDLTAVAQGIDAANSSNPGLSLQEVETALLAAAEQAAELKAIAEAPNALSRGNLTYRNVAAALIDAKQLATSDMHLKKGVPIILEELLQLLTEMKAIPEASALLPNYPNPFNPETWMPYHLAKATDVTLTIHDLHGRVVRVLDFGHQQAGIYQSRGRAAYWDGKNQIGEKVASGLYFYTLTTSDFTATRKMLIAK